MAHPPWAAVAHGGLAVRLQGIAFDSTGQKSATCAASTSARMATWWPRASLNGACVAPRVQALQFSDENKLSFAHRTHRTHRAIPRSHRLLRELSIALRVHPTRALVLQLACRLPRHVTAEVALDHTQREVDSRSRGSPRPPASSAPRFDDACSSGSISASRSRLMSLVQTFLVFMPAFSGTMRSSTRSEESPKRC